MSKNMPRTMILVSHGYNACGSIQISGIIRDGDAGVRFEDIPSLTELLDRVESAVRREDPNSLYTWIDCESGKTFYLSKKITYT